MNNRAALDAIDLGIESKKKKGPTRQEMIHRGRGGAFFRVGRLHSRTSRGIPVHVRQNGTESLKKALTWSWSSCASSPAQGARVLDWPDAPGLVIDAGKTGVIGALITLASRNWDRRSEFHHRSDAPPPPHRGGREAGMKT